MKLVIATPLYPPEIGGPATYAKLLESGLPEKGTEVELVKFSEVRHLPKIIRHYAYYRHVLKAARNADAVLALDPVSVGLPAMYAARKAEKPFVVKIVGDYAWEQGTQRFGITQTLDEFVKMSQRSFLVRIFQRIQTRVTHGAARVIVPSDYLKNIVTTWGIPNEKIKVIYNAVITDKSEIGNVPESVRNLPGIRVVTAGRLVPWKNIDQVIEVVDKVMGATWAVRRGGKQISLIIIGDGPQRRELEARATLLLKSNFVFTGQLSHADTLATMKAADIFILNSSYEGLSHVLIEAQSLGIPSIVTNVGGNIEVVLKGGAKLVKLGDTGGLVSSLEWLASDAEERKSLSKCAKESAERFSVNTMLTATTALLKDV